MVKIEQKDPCKRAEQLRNVRDELITGQKVAEYDFEAGNGVRRRLKYTTADLSRLDREIASAENACALKQGERGCRFALTARG